MNWLWVSIGAAGVLGAGVGLRKLIAALKPLPDDGRRYCPHCGHEFEGTRRYCLACGGQIWEDVWSEGGP